MIEGIVVKHLATHTDERGFFREIIRVTDGFFQEGFGQWSHSLMHAGTAKAWHVHQRQTDWWYVALGTLKVALYDTRPDSPTWGELMEFLLGDNHPAQVVKIPPGVAHAARPSTGRRTYSTSRPTPTIRPTKAASPTMIPRSATTGQPRPPSHSQPKVR